MAAVGLTVCLLLGTTLWLNAPIRFPLDDAYITIANAELVLNGGVDSFGLDRPTGATSIAHLLALIALGPAFPLVLANMLIACCAIVALASGLWTLARTLEASPLVAAGLAIIGLLVAESWFQLMNGLETGMAMASVAWVMALILGPRTKRRDVSLAVLLGILPFLRPELAGLSALVAIELGRQLRSRLRCVAGLAMISAAICATMAVVAIVLTGSVLPATAGAKEAFFAEATLPLHLRVAILGHMALSPVFPFILGVFFLLKLRGGWPAVAFTAIFFIMALHTLPGGLAHNSFRYLYPLVPMGLAGWVAFGARCKSKRFASAMMAFLSVFVGVQFAAHGWSSWRNTYDATVDQEELAEWAAANLPGDARVLVHDAGYFAWATDFDLVDLVGLKTPGSITVHRRHTLPTAGAARSRAIDEIARAGRVSHAIILDRWFWDRIGDGLRETGWDLSLLRPGMYEVYRLTPPDAGTD